MFDEKLGTAEKFKLINEAYNILSHADKKSEYDSIRSYSSNQA